MRARIANPRYRVADKFSRSLRKYYSADGSIEIKYTKAVGAIPEKVEFYTYIGGDAYSAPVVVRKIDAGNYENFYLHRDHLGSILAITNNAGVVVEKRLFDAWGKILKIQNGAGATLTKLTFFDRGYTGHEHMEGVELINMNGRIYDPQLHRFLQPDNNIQDPYNTQNFNRYGYVLNNPLKYTDESGEFLGFILGAILNAYISTAQSTGDGNPLNWNAQTWQSFGYNTASSAASYGATSYANSYVNNYNNKPDIKRDVNSKDDIETFENLNSYQWDINGDGKLQKVEADLWGVKGHGKPIEVDNSKIDWSGLKIPKGKDLGDFFSLETHEAFLVLPFETASTYGGTSFQVYGKTTVIVINQRYHYDMRNNNSNFKDVVRDFLTQAGYPSVSEFYNGPFRAYQINYLNPKINIK